jgi:ribosomal protein L4
MLSAKLYEDKIVFIDTEEITVPKTQVLEEIISPFRNDKLCFVTSSKVNENF